MNWNDDMSAAPRCYEAVIIYQPDVSRNSEWGEGYFAPVDYEGDDNWHWADNNAVAHPTHWAVPAPPSPTQGDRNGGGE